jgi:uncharacterized protein (TIGR02466 family)
MNLNAIHVTPVAQFNASQFVAYGNSLFEIVDLKEVPNYLYLSSLRKYVGTKHEEVPNSEPLKNFIIDCAKEFFTALGGSVDDYEFKVAGIWLNEMKSGTSHGQHNHWAHALSGTFYVDMPPNTSGITFVTPLNVINRFKMNVKEYTTFNSESMTMQPAIGDLLMWESHLRHEVPPAEYEGVRRCIGFDIDLMEKTND